MGHRISAGSGNASSVAVWDTGVNTPTVHASTNISVAQNATVYSAVFTAPNTSNASTGVLAFCATAPTGASTLTFALQEYNGSTWTTKASQAVNRSEFTVNSAAVNWFNVRWGTPYTWTTTTAGYYRIAITNGNVSGTAPQLAADSGGANFAFLTFDDRHAALAGTDIYWIGGNLASSTRYTITQDADFSATGGDTTGGNPLNRQVTNAFNILSYGTWTPTVSATTKLSIKGNGYITNGGEFLVGSLGTPFPASYSFTIEFQCLATGDCSFSIDPRGTCKMYGSWRSTVESRYTSGAGTTVNPLVINGDNTALGWVVDDEIFIGASVNKADSKRKFIKTIVSANPLTVTLSDTAGGTESGLAATYNSNSIIYNAWRNVIVKSSSATYQYLWGFGGSVSGSGFYTMAADGYAKASGVQFRMMANSASYGGFTKFSYMGCSGGTPASLITMLSDCVFVLGYGFQYSQSGPSYQKISRCVLWGSDSSYLNMLLSPNNSFFCTFDDCLAFRATNAAGLYHTNGTYLRFRAISCNYMAGSSSLGANNSLVDCEAHCCDGAISAGSVNLHVIRGRFGTKGKNVQDINVLAGFFSPNLISESTNFGSDVTVAGNSNYLPGSSIFLSLKNGIDANEFYDQNGRWYTEGGALSSAPDQSAAQATYPYRILTQLVSGFKLYVETTLEILSAAYYAGTHVLPQLILAADQGATTVTGTATATTASQKLGVIITPATNLNTISAGLGVKTDAAAPNNKVKWSALKANLRAIGYRPIESTVDPLYKPIQDAILSIGTPVDDPFWLERNAGTLAGWSSLFTIDHVAQTITVHASATAYQLYDYANYDLTLDQNRGIPTWYTTIDGKQDASAYSLVVADGAVLSGTGKRLTLAAGKTMTLNGTGNVTFPVATDSGTRVPIAISGLVDGSRVRIQRIADGSLLAGGISSTTFTAYQVVTDDIPVLVRVRKGASAPKYLPYEAQGTITTNGLSLVVAQVQDLIAESTFDPDLGLVADWAAKRLQMTAPFTSLSVQELVNFCRAEEDTVSGITNDHIIDATGKQALSQTVAVGITCTLRSTWMIEWYPGNYTASIGGGNLVSETGDTVAYVENGPQVEITLSAAATIVTIGSGLSTEEHDLLVAARDYAGIAAVNSQV